MAENGASQPTTDEDELSKVKLADYQKSRHTGGGILIDGESGYQVKFAKCCNPLPGDRIVGFITRGFGVSVHKADCPNVALSRRNEENLSRWVNVQWEKDEGATKETYEASLSVIADDTIGVIAAVTTALADMKVSISQINTQVLRTGGKSINITVGCRSTAHYDAIVARLRTLPSVISVTRGFAH